MLSLLLVLLSLSQSVEYPKWAQIFTGIYTTEEAVKIEYETFIKETCKESGEEEEEGWSYDECMKYVNALQGYYFSQGSNINEVLKNIPKQTEFLIIVGFGFHEIDFNNLKSQMKIGFEYDDEVSEEENIRKNHLRETIKRMRNVSFDGSNEKIMEFFKTKKHSKEDNQEIISIVGNIKNKVSFLGLDTGIFKFTKNDVDCHSLGLGEASISEESTNIKTEFLLLDSDSYNNNGELFEEKDGFIQIKQLTFKDNGYGDYTYTITYNQDSWNLNIKSNDEESWGDNQEYTFPYSKTNTFNLLTRGNKFVIKLADDVKLDSYQPLNITVKETGHYTEMWAKQLEKKTITITQEGFDDKKPEVILSYDKELYSFDENSNPGIKVEEPYVYKPKKEKDGPNVGMIVGIVVAVVVVIVIVVVVVIVVIRKKKNAGGQSASEGEA